MAAPEFHMFHIISRSNRFPEGTIQQCLDDGVHDRLIKRGDYLVMNSKHFGKTKFMLFMNINLNQVCDFVYAARLIPISRYKNQM